MDINQVAMVVMEEIKEDAKLIEIVTILKDVMQADAQLLMLIVLIADLTKNVSMGDVFLLITQAVDQIVIARIMKYAS